MPEIASKPTSELKSQVSSWECPPGSAGKPADNKSSERAKRLKKSKVRLYKPEFQDLNMA